jgi:dTDP-4-amino-4,6-dideoxygalactose transaminase
MIQMVDLKKQFEGIREEIVAAVREVLESAQYILGPRVKEFERKVADYCGTAEAVGVASGTDALHLSMAALGIGRGDEVITTPFTFFSTVEAILYVGATPVFADIDPETFNIDPSGVEERITSKTRAILPVHLFGHPADMEAIVGIARKRGLAVVEDCAQAFGASMGGRKVGSFGDAGCFSFYPSKNLGACGDGVMVAASDASLADSVRMLRNHGSKGSYEHARVGYNSRLDELQAAVLLVKLERIDAYNELRRKNAKHYDDLMSGRMACPVEREGFRHAYHQYTVRSAERDEIRNRLAGAGIASNVYYPVPLHLQEALKFLGHKRGDFEKAEKAAEEVLSLPMYPELEEGEIARVAEIVLSV